ncbi:MAG: hypothetical protein AVDCRST_MAG68-611, partial [uncultured Gemmatimonadetes bacterium]
RGGGRGFHRRVGLARRHDGAVHHHGDPARRRATGGHQVGAARGGGFGGLGLDRLGGVGHRVGGRVGGGLGGPALHLFALAAAALGSAGTVADGGFKCLAHVFVAQAPLALDHRTDPGDVLVGQVRHVAADGDVHLPEEVHQGLSGNAQFLGDFEHTHLFSFLRSSALR